ncbi:MAG: pilus assembly protein N-terminal domain-containing protein [Candidatus Sumerlaeia bacterium]|nr:pilus assembly protein N-terminal domain-containing protein [Candidatus Sumerlaeia bacterium]
MHTTIPAHSPLRSLASTSRTLLALAAIAGLAPAPAPAQQGSNTGVVPATQQEGPLFGAGRTRLPLLDVSSDMLGAAPRPTPEVAGKFSQYIEQAVDPEATLDLVQGRSRLLKLRRVPIRVETPNERLLSVIILSEREISVYGKEVGTTTLNITFTDISDPSKTTVLSYLVRVLPDPEERVRLERIYKALEKEVNDGFPNSFVELSLVGDKLVVRGQARDAREADQIMKILISNAPLNELVKIPTSGMQPLAAEMAADPGGASLPGATNYQIAGHPNIINLLRIPGESQVELQVTIAEVNRAAGRAIGMNFQFESGESGDGTLRFANLTGNLLNGGNIPVSFVSQTDKYQFAVRALRNLQLARAMAEPKLVTINGQKASFRAGGEFPIPVLGSNSGSVLQGTEFKDFGVTLNFTPYITDRDRIRLDIQAKVSDRVSSAGGGSSVPGVDSRNFSTTVELQEGQTLAVAGLTQTTFGSSSDRIPLLGDLPFIGQFFGSTTTASAETELVILVRPEIIAPLDSTELPPLPGSDMFEPDDLEFYILNRLESRTSDDYRSAARTNFDRIARYRRMDKVYIAGPAGQSTPR